MSWGNDASAHIWRFDQSDFTIMLRHHHYLPAFSTCLFEMGNKFPKFFWSNKHELSKICPLSRHVVYFLSGSFKKYVKPIYRTPRLRITFFFHTKCYPMWWLNPQHSTRGWPLEPYDIRQSSCLSFVTIFWLSLIVFHAVCGPHEINKRLP